MLKEISCPMHKRDSIPSADFFFLPTAESDHEGGYDSINPQSHYYDCSRSGSSSNTGNSVQNQQYDSGNPIVDNELPAANEGSTHNDT